MDLREEWEKSEDAKKEQEIKTKLREEAKEPKEKKDHSFVIKLVSALVAAALVVYAVYCIVVAII